MIRYTLYYSGHVQGVGFRYTAREIAQDYPLSGQIRNLDDGRVALILEGEKDQLDDFLLHLGRRMARFIKDKTLATSPATGEFGHPEPGGLSIHR